VLSALIHRLGRVYSPIPPKLVLWIFVTSDIIATVAQITGASLIGVKESNGEDSTTANYILLGGLAFQVFATGIFIIMTCIFIFRSRQRLRSSNLTTFITAFMAATVLIYLRTCFRLAETAEGLGGHLSTHEVYFGALEFAPVVLAVVLFAIWHPGRCVGSKVGGSSESEAKPRGSDVEMRVSE
jgi:hypothetical protein